MAYAELGDYTFNAQLIDMAKLKSDTFNPTDYLDFSSNIVTKTSTLNTIAEVKSKLVESTGGVKRVMANMVDRATGEVLEPMTAEFQKLSCVPFDNGDIIIHKYASRVGRVGICESEGFAEHHFIRVKPSDVRGYYLLLALRSIPVLRQLPFRETARPGIRKGDVEALRIPRLGDDTENKLSGFLQEIFRLRKRIRMLLNGLLSNFNGTFEWTIPKEGAFFTNASSFTSETLDPGYYVMRMLKTTFKNSSKLGDLGIIIYPHSLNAGDRFTALTLADYRYEGILPETLKGVIELWDTNYTQPQDIILNRLQSGEERPAKATVVLKGLDYLKDYGLTIEANTNAKVPIYDQLFIVRIHSDSPVSPYYLSLFFNSDLFQNLFVYLMGGSTGRQRLRKTKLLELRIPLLETEKMEKISEAVRIGLETQSATFMIMTLLSRAYEDAITGESSVDTLSSFIDKHADELNNVSTTLDRTNEVLIETANLTYG